MITIREINNRKCRTCLDNTKGLQLLNKVAAETKRTEMAKTYADILEEVTQINISADADNENIPKEICFTCRPKLVAAYDYVKQVQEVNRHLWKSFNILDTCLEEHQIEYPLESNSNVPQIKSETHSEQSPGNIEKDMHSCDDKLSEDDLPLCEVKLKIEIDDEHNNTDVGLNSSANPNENVLQNNLDENSKVSVTAVSESITNKEQQSGKIKRTTKRTKIKSPDITDGDLAASMPCNMCNKRFQDLKELTIHRRKIHKLSICPLCDRTIEFPANIYRHMRKSHGEESVKTYLPPARVRKQQHIYKCEQCQQTFRIKSRLKNHIEKKHNNINIKKKEPKPRERNHLCTYCGLSFQCNAHLTIHIRTHTKEKPFKCDLCDRAFCRIFALREHKRIHSGDKPFACKECGKSFRMQGTFNDHVRSHTDQRQYQCPECGKAFKFAKHLTVHKLVHTGERPYSCELCSSTFTQLGPLQAHRTKCISANGQL